MKGRQNILQEVNRQKFITSISLSVFIAANIFLFSPFTIYKGNINEFIIPLTTILTFFLFPALIIASTLCVIGLLLPKKFHQRYISILFAIGILIWLQGNIIVWKYGVFDGKGIDWSVGIWRGWLDGAIWCVLIIFAFRFCNKVYKISNITSILLILLQVSVIIYTSIQKPDIWKKKDVYSQPIKPPEEIFQFSSTKNVIHVILDAFQSDIFQEIIDDDMDYYYEELEGFTFFRETAGCFTQTYMSIPAILSGVSYNNDIPMPEFIDKVLKGKTIPNVLHEKGYITDLALNTYFGTYFTSNLKDRYSSTYRIPDFYGNNSRKKNVLIKSAFMMDLVLFRHSPHFIKKLVYRDGQWLFKRFVSEKNRLLTFHFAHLRFLQDVIGGMTVKRNNKPVYKLIHLISPHAPLVVGDDCEYVGENLPYNRENMTKQAKCSLNQFVHFINKLKSEKIYASSLIILQSDHGAAIPVNIQNMEELSKKISTSYGDNFASVVGTALPVLAIKPPYSNGLLRISNVQSSLADIPATICSILNIDTEFDGQSVFDIALENARERQFKSHRMVGRLDLQEYMSSLDVFNIRGSIFNSNSWSLVSTYYSQGLSYHTDKIDIGTQEDSHFLQNGWGNDEQNEKQDISYCWALKDSASIFLSLPKNEAVLLTANVKSPRFSIPQIVTVKVDGRKIGSWELSPSWNWEKHRIVIPSESHREEVSNVEFNFSQHRVPNGEGDQRALAVLFESITLSKP